MARLPEFSERFRRDAELLVRLAHGNVVQVLEGEEAIASNRDIMGATNPADAAPGTIRAEFANSIEENVVHGSDGPDTAREEIAFFFSDDQICPRTRNG